MRSSTDICMDSNGWMRWWRWKKRLQVYVQWVWLTDAINVRLGVIKHVKQECKVSQLLKKGRAGSLESCHLNGIESAKKCTTQPAGDEGGGERKVRWNSSCAPQGIPWAFCPEWTAWVTTSSSGLHQGQTGPPWPDPR